MTERKRDGSYYAKLGMVWKSPVETRLPEWGTSISMGFPVCKMHDAVGDDAAESVAELMNSGDQHDALVKALTEILEANKSFRASMPKMWDGDPLQGACERAASVLAAVGQTRERE